MIDVLLTILVFFMTITSAQVLKVDKSIELPIAKDAQKKDNTRAEAILNVRWQLAQKKALFVFDDRTYKIASEKIEPLKVAKLTGEKKSPRARIQPSVQSSAATATCPRFTSLRR